MKSYESFRIAISATLTWLVLFSHLGFASNINHNHKIKRSKQSVYSIALSVSETIVGNTITVNWTAPEGHSASDYVRLTQVSFADNNYSWENTLGLATSGSFTATIPNTVARYEFRIFNGLDNTRLVKSQSFIANKASYSFPANPLTIPVGGQITVDWNAPINRPVTDRLVITQANTTGVVSQQFTSGANPRSLNFTAPSQPGQYEIQYFETNASQPSALSQIVTVESAVGSFAGQVKKGGTEAYISGAVVKVLQNNVVQATSTTNSNGSYTIPILVTGTFDIQVTATGFPVTTRSDLVLSDGNTTVVDFVLYDTGFLKGKITKSESGVAISGAKVQIKQGATVIKSGYADYSGNYNFSHLTPGNYSVDVSAIGFASQTQSNVSIIASNTTTLNLILTGNQSGGSNDLEYVYDDVGRLVATKEQGTVKNIYNYDQTGNLISISSLQGVAPAIISFSPRNGPPGTQVVVRGVNFRNTPAQNMVNFNGATATVTSSSITEIVSIVPSGATTGNISITTPDGVATSSFPFTVGAASANLSPAVTGFSPVIGHPGDLLTINGSNFESEASDNSVLIGSSGTGVISATSSALQVRADTSSGKVSVTTPNGTGISGAEFLSVPNTVDTTTVDYSGRTWFGHNKLINIPIGDRKGAVTFDGILGKRFSIQLFDLSNPIKIDIFRPDGRLLSTNTFSNQSSAESWFIDTQTFPLTGTYTTIISPVGTTNNPTFFRMMVYDVPPDVSGEMPLNAYKKVFIGTPGQNGLLTFNATAGQKILMNIKDNTYSGFASVARSVSTNSYPPPPVFNYGFQVIGVNFSPEGVTIPATGTYNLTLNPSGPSTGPMDVSLYIVPPDPTYSINIGFSETFYITNPGQNAWVEFSGVAGQRISLQTRGVTFTDGFGISLNKPDGTFFVMPILANNGTFIDTLTLPVTGTYKIYINPSGYNTGQTTIDLYNVPPDIVGSTSINGSAVTVSNAIPGHNPTVTFDALQGQQARVNITGATFPNGTQVFIKKFDGTILASGSLNTGTGLINSTTLPVSGTYSIEINPAGINLGGATISVGGDVFGTITLGGNSSSITVNNSGQSAWLSFSGTAGQRVSLKLTNANFASGSVSIRNPDGSSLGNIIRVGSSNFIDTVTLPVNGEYKVLIDPDSDYTGSATVTLYNVPSDAAGAISVGGDSQTRTTTVPGQNLLLSFTGIANQKISLEITNVSIPHGTSVVIRKPNGESLLSTSVDSSGTILNNIVLPETGIFEIFVNPSNEDVGNITLQIYGTGTGNPDPTFQFWQSVSVRKGLDANIINEFLSSVSVQKGSVFGSNPLEEFTSSVSVKRGTFSGNTTSSEISNSVSIRYGNQQDHLLGGSVSVSTGPVISGLTPEQLMKGSTNVLTISGSNMNNANAVRFYNSSGNMDTSISATNISVNPEGTILTATIQINSNAVPGERIVVINTSSHGISRTDNYIVNAINVTQ